LRLDKDIAHFLKFIDEYLGKHNVIVYLSSDGGLAPNSDFNKNEKLPGNFFDSERANLLLRAYLNAKYGHGQWIKKFMNQQIYLNRNLIEDSNISLKDFQEDVCQFIMQFSGVSAVSNSVNLQSDAANYQEVGYMKNSYKNKRSGDILIKLEAGWSQNKQHSISHNYGYNSETHVPLIWYGWKISRSTISEQISVVDIVPTISSLINISCPNACQGKTIIELLK
jgi:arylsulfatase A-like enzyme